MNKIKIVTPNEKDNLFEMFNTYMHELAQFDPTIKFKNNIVKYKWFNNYFVDKDRFAFYFVNNNTIAGFALIRQIECDKFEIAEFYVDPQFRQNNNSLWFANSVVDLFKGEFQFCTRCENVRAIKFWDKFVLNKQLIKSLIENDNKHWVIK